MSNDSSRDENLFRDAVAHVLEMLYAYYFPHFIVARFTIASLIIAPFERVYLCTLLYPCAVRSDERNAEVEPVTHNDYFDWVIGERLSDRFGKVGRSSML